MYLIFKEINSCDYEHGRILNRTIALNRHFLLSLSLIFLTGTKTDKYRINYWFVFGRAVNTYMIDMIWRGEYVLVRFLSIR
jgi:hypothetical protein